VSKEKRCTRCGNTYPLSKFHRDSRGKDGRRSSCAKCVSELSKEASKRPPVVDPDVTHKVCGRCERLGRESLHPIESFGIARRMKDGRNSWCKTCCSEATSDWQRTEVGRRKHIEAVKRYRERKKWGSSATNT
tara:strand:+ start:7541 stop:7939 length:399 start_codon:yes stop_codon:yes gene_type:complete